MTSTISVSPAAFAAAGQTYGTARDTAAGIITALAKSLDDHWGCAGTDTTGQSFAGTYDPAAFNAMASGADIVNGLAQLHDLLEYTSVNHANGNTRAAVGAQPTDTAQPAALTAHYDAPKFKGSYGGNTDAPFGWGLITRWLQGRVRPNGHQDGLDALDTAWDDAATGLAVVAKTVGPAREIVDEQISNEVPQILSQIDLVVADINAAVTQFQSLGSACSQYADALTIAHNAIGKALSELVIFAGIGAIVGSLIGPEGTAGGTALAAGARGEVAAIQVNAAIDALTEAITPVRAALAGTAVAAGPITKNLQPLLDAKPTQFNANTRPGGQPIPPKPFRPGRDQPTAFNGEQAAQDVRADLGGAGAQQRVGRNIGVAQAEINGQFVPSTELRAVSGGKSPDGTLPVPQNPVLVPASEDGTVVRPSDTEFKILEHLRQKFNLQQVPPGTAIGSNGTVDLYTEQTPCPACKNVVRQFEENYGVKVNVTYSVQ